MSYDLMVFDPAVAPRDRGAFVEWYHHQAEWSEGHSYDDPAITTEGLRALYRELCEAYPDMNGPGAPSDDDLSVSSDEQLTDYTIGRDVIYMAFRWSQAAQAHSVVRDLAVKHGVGFYDPSGSEEIHFPGDPLPSEPIGFLQNLFRKFKDLKTQ